MKKCLNCQKEIKDNDKYCRNCGCLIEKNSHYILVNILTILVTVAIIILIILFIASYMLSR